MYIYKERRKGKVEEKPKIERIHNDRLELLLLHHFSKRLTPSQSISL